MANAPDGLIPLDNPDLFRSQIVKLVDQEVDLGVGSFDLALEALLFVWVAGETLFRFVEQDVLFDPIQIRFLGPAGVMLQPQPIADLVKKSFFGGSMPASVYNFFGRVYS